MCGVALLASAIQAQGAGNCAVYSLPAVAALVSLLLLLTCEMNVFFGKKTGVLTACFQFLSPVHTASSWSLSSYLADRISFVRILPFLPRWLAYLPFPFSTANAGDRALFAALNSSVPAIAPRGTPSSMVGVVYDGVADAACWWTYKGCTVPKLKGLQADITRCAEPNTWGFTVSYCALIGLRGLGNYNAWRS